jgi:hypothetical protein
MPGSTVIEPDDASGSRSRVAPYRGSGSLFDTNRWLAPPASFPGTSVPSIILHPYGKRISSELMIRKRSQSIAMDAPGYSCSLASIRSWMETQLPDMLREQCEAELEQTSEATVSHGEKPWLSLTDYTGG